MENVNEYHEDDAPTGDGPNTLFASESDGATLPDVPSEDEIEQFKNRGALLVAHRKEIVTLEKKIANIEFGNVKGAALSVATRTLLAEFCFMVHANPVLHLALFGGRPFLMETYWSDKLNIDPYFIRYEQRDLSPAVENELRAQAKELRKESESLMQISPDGAGKLRLRAIEMEQDAREIAMARVQWGARATATAVYETTIWRFMPATPIELIRSGQLTDFDRYIQPVRECNWAGGVGIVTRKKSKANGGGTFETDGDPIGDAEPAKTARSRSLRRTAAKGFSTWGKAEEERIRRIEQIVEAEWEDVTRDSQAPTGRLAIASGAGEPTATRAALPQPLPVRDLSGIGSQRQPEPVRVADTQTRSEPARRTTAAEPAPEPRNATETTDSGSSSDLTDDQRQELRKRLFPSLQENGIRDEPGRKQWATDNELPESTKMWTQRDFDEAFRILEGPARAELLEAVGSLGFESVDEFCTKRTIPIPVVLKDVKALTKVIQASR